MLRKASYSTQHSHCLVSDFLPHATHKHISTCRYPLTTDSYPSKICYTITENATNLTTLQDMEIKQSCYNDIGGTPTLQDTSPLENTPFTHSTLEQDGETTTE